MPDGNTNKIGHNTKIIWFIFITMKAIKDINKRYIKVLKHYIEHRSEFLS